MQKPLRTIYLDHAATTAVDPRVVEAMLFLGLCYIIVRK